MRELYACQLDLIVEPEQAAPELARAEQLIREWISRPTSLAAGDLVDGQHAADHHTVEVTRAVDPASGHEGWMAFWTRPDDKDAGLRWTTRVAVGQLDDEILRTTIRIGIEQSADGHPLRQPRYEFRTPAITRTLVRGFEVHDCGRRLTTEPWVITADGTADLAEFVTDVARALPIVVLSVDPIADGPLADPAQVSRELAGLAHVAVLESHGAGLRLAEELGQELSVWHGAARIYWPGFRRDDEPGRHRYWSPQALRPQPARLLNELRRWLGTLSAAVVPQHPLVANARAALVRLPEPDAVPDWAEQVLAEYEAQIKALEKDKQELLKDLAEAREETDAAWTKYAELIGRADGEAVAATDWSAVTVVGAYELAKAHCSPHVVFEAGADKSVAQFSSYKDPKKLYDALMTIDDAARKWQTGDLGAGFGEYFAGLGYEYSQRNPAATARRTKRHYEIRYQGDLVSMKPHLKVDQNTSPDQCLRIYWYQDTAIKVLVIGHVGRHLPEA